MDRSYIPQPHALPAVGDPLRTDRGLPLPPRVQAVEAAAPGQDALVRRHQPVAAQGGGDDDAVGRVGVEVGQGVGADADVAIHGDFDQALTEEFPAPRLSTSSGEVQPVFDPEHRHLPESEGRDSRIIVPPGQF